MQKFLIIGSDGFVGRNLLRQRNDTNICYDSTDKLFGKNARLSLITDQIKINKNILDSYDGVLLTACSLKPSSSIDSYESAIKNEFLPIIKIAETISLKKKKLIYFSSAGSLYHNETGTAEGSLVYPVNFYGLFKKQVEDFLLLMNKNSGLNYQIYRISNIYGPDQGLTLKQGLISAVINCIRTGSALDLYTDLSSKKDYIYIDDVIQIINILIFESDGIYNIGSGVSTSIGDIISSVESLANKRILKNMIPESQLHQNIHNLDLDISKMKSVVNDIEFIGIDEGLRRCFEGSAPSQEFKQI